MQKLKNIEKVNNVNNFFEVQEKSLNYQIAVILTKLELLTQKHNQTDNKIEEFVNINTTRFEVINKQIEETKKDISLKIGESDNNTNERFSAMQIEITSLKNSDGRKAMNILKVLLGIFIAVVTALAVAFTSGSFPKDMKTGDYPLDFNPNYCIIEICHQNTQLLPIL